MEQVRVHVEAEVNPTESEAKVRRAVENVLGSIPLQAKPQHKGSLLIGDAKGTEALTKLYNILRRERIRAAARKSLLEGRDARSLSFSLNKQVAYAGQVSFSTENAESPLGPIKVRIECGNPRELINWLTQGIQ